MVHAIATKILLDWRAIATGQTRSDIIPRLALLNAWLDDEPRPVQRPLVAGSLPNARTAIARARWTRKSCYPPRTLECTNPTGLRPLITDNTVSSSKKPSALLNSA